MSAPKTFLEAEEALAASLPNYESRPQQQALAQAIEKSIENRTHLLAEAGCGTGKSLGYAIPAILSGERVVISTATKALQDQIFKKDLPFLAEHLGVDFSYALVKGRSNYACLLSVMVPDEGADVAQFVERIEREATEPWDGTRETIGFEVTDADWKAVTRSSDECPGKKQCPFGESCYAEKAKDAGKAADIVVVNHALLFTDMKLRSVTGGAASMLSDVQSGKDFDYVIFDEAHEIEDWATNSLAERMTFAGMQNLCGEVRNWAHSEHLDYGKEIGAVLEAVTTLWDTWPNEDRRIYGADLLEREEPLVNLIGALSDLADLVERKVTQAAPSKAAAVHRKLVCMREAWVSFVADDFSKTVRWIETLRNRRGVSKIVRSAPIHVAEYLRDHLFSHKTAILVSATLATKNGDFTFVADRLGIDHYDAVDVGTPFDFPTQALLYVPSHLPSPKRRDEWAQAAEGEVAELVRASRGRALVLCTSVSQMRRIAEHLREEVSYPVYLQGEAPNQVLADRFMHEVDSILVATKTFFTGVDFQGEACSLVVMDKLPFDVPNDPLIEARSEAVEASGGNSFADFTIPRMTLVLRQGFGRLIRHREDRGVVAILDERLVSTGYGKGICRSLPDAPLVTGREEAVQFLR